MPKKPLLPELITMGKIEALLREHDADEVNRILDWISARFPSVHEPEKVIAPSIKGAYPTVDEWMKQRRDRLEFIDEGGSDA